VRIRDGIIDTGNDCTPLSPPDVCIRASYEYISMCTLVGSVGGQRTLPYCTVLLPGSQLPTPTQSGRLLRWIRGRGGRMVHAQIRYSTGDIETPRSEQHDVLFCRFTLPFTFLLFLPDLLLRQSLAHVLCRACGTSPRCARPSNQISAVPARPRRCLPCDLRRRKEEPIGGAPPVGPSVEQLAPNPPFQRADCERGQSTCARYITHIAPWRSAQRERTHGGGAALQAPDRVAIKARRAETYTSANHLVQPHSTGNSWLVSSGRLIETPTVSAVDNQSDPRH